MTAAFIQKNRIYPDKPPTDEELEEYEKNMTPEEKGRRIRASIMAEGIEFTRIRKSIGDGK